MLFSQSIVCLFIFLKLSSYEQKIRIFIKSSLLTFHFSLSACCDLFKESLPAPISHRYISMFCSRSFMMLGFTFRSMIHLKLNLCICEVRVQVHFLLMRLLGHLLKRLLHPHRTAQGPLSKINRVYILGSISGFHSALSIYLPTFRRFAVGVYVIHDMIYSKWINQGKEWKKAHGEAKSSVWGLL